MPTITAHDTPGMPPESAATTTVPTVALPTVTPPPASTLTTTAPDGADTRAAQDIIFTSPRYSYTVVLPCCWLALPTSGTALESVLADQGGEMPLWGDLAARVRERETGALLELIALLPDEENVTLPVAQMTVSVLPAYGMTLDAYASATSEELTHIANTSVRTTYIEPLLGVEQFPAAVIEYTAAPKPAIDADMEQSIAGMQVAFFSDDADSLIVLTFTTAAERFEELQPIFLHIVRSVTLRDAAI